MATIRVAMLALSIKQLTKTYSNGLQALKGIDFDVESGDFYALLGPNGAGKTTAIGIVCSLVNKTSGQVEIFGHNIDTDVEAAKACIGLVPQELNLNIFDSVLNIVVNQAGYYGIPRELALKRAEQRSMWEFLRNINEAGTTIILTTHYLEEAETLCRHVAIIDDGKIIENARMSTVIRKLQREVFVLSLREPLSGAPVLDGFETALVEDCELEVTVDADTDLNTLFARLNDTGIEVISLRNKANRLEELFMDLVESKQGVGQAAVR
jgi:ABC-2 type transport system ATP-binding protein